MIAMLVNLQFGLLGLLASCAKDFVSGAENALRRTLADRPASAPMLDVTPAELRAWKAKRLTAKQSHGLGLDFADITGSCLGFRKVLLVGMT
jgi:hypothetical protein